jgi:hypothetical protein
MGAHQTKSSTDTTEDIKLPDKMDDRKTSNNRPFNDE